MNNNDEYIAILENQNEDYAVRNAINETQLDLLSEKYNDFWHLYRVVGMPDGKYIEISMFICPLSKIKVIKESLINDVKNDSNILGFKLVQVPMYINNKVTGVHGYGYFDRKFEFLNAFEWRYENGRWYPAISKQFGGTELFSHTPCELSDIIGKYNERNNCKIKCLALHLIQNL